MKKALLLVILVVTPVSVFADDRGFYGHLDYGIYRYRNASQGSSDGFRIGVGYQFSTNLGLEAGYSMIEDASNSCADFLFFASSCPKDTLSASSSQVAFVGTLPVFNKSYGVFGKIGWATTSLDRSYSDNNVSGNGSVTKSNPMFGIGYRSYPGLRLHHLSWRLQYENFGKMNLTTNYNNQTSSMSKITVEVYSFGLIYDF